MKKFRTYRHALSASISNPAYYLSLTTSRVWFSIQFFFLTLLFVALGSIPRLIFRDIPQTVADIRLELNRIVEQLPADAVFSYSEDTLKFHGIPLPFTLYSSDHLQSIGYPKDLLTFQATDSASKAALTMTSKQIFLSMDGSEPTQFPYPDVFGDVSGSVARDQIKTAITGGLDEIIKNRLMIAVILSGGLFLSSLFTGIFTIFFYSLLIQILGWVVGFRMHYRTALRWGLHIFPIAYGIQEISKWTVRGSTFPILVVSYIAISLLIIWTGRRDRPTINL